VLQKFGIIATEGCNATELLENAPAHRSGLKARDMITPFNGRRVITSSDIDFEIWRSFIGDSMTMNADRAGESRGLKFTLKELR
jgi:S1-C subfamily serine protease